MTVAGVSVEAVTDKAWLDAFLVERWGAPGPVSRGRVHHASDLFAVAVRDEAGIAGVVTWCVAEGTCELATIDSLRPRRGVGTMLLDAAVRAARGAGAKRLWLITTNDNLDALRFYQRRGWQLAALHPGAVAESRRVKPAIPEVGDYGIPIRDEIELEFPL